jgi:hypothetical protein
MRSLMIKVDEYYAWLIVLPNLFLQWITNIEKSNQLELVLKSWK